MKFSPYIYEPDKSMEVYKETEKYFETNPEIKKRIEELGWIYHTVGMIIPHNFENFWSGYFFLSLNLGKNFKFPSIKFASVYSNRLSFH